MPSIIADMKLPPPTGQLGTTGIHSSSSKVANSVAADNIGSFRADRDWEDALPSNLRNLLALEVEDDETVEEAVPRLISRNRTYALLNAGAFGTAYDAVRELATALRRYSEDESEIFYDQLCIPLVRRSLGIARRFFGTERCLFVPNCTVGMKGVLERLVSQGHSRLAALAPIYGATEKLLEYLANGKKDVVVTSVIPRSHGRDVLSFLVEEDPSVIIASLEKAHREQGRKKFTVLCGDAVASQSGRVLPLPEVGKWCRERGVVFVVDATQSLLHWFDWNLGNPKKDGAAMGIRPTDICDYLVMSTHKWMGNVKTAGFVVYAESMPPPLPHAVSFGYEKGILHGETAAQDAVDRSFEWSGMGAQYINYITAGLAIEAFSMYGKAQMLHADRLLKVGLTKILQTRGCLPGREFLPEGNGTPRSMNLIKVPASDFAYLFTEEPKNRVSAAEAVRRVQNMLQENGVQVSVKVFDASPASSTSCGGEGSCPRQTDENNNAIFLRISSWSYNTELGFHYLANVLNRNTCFSQEHLLLGNANKGANLLRHQFLQTWEHTERLFSALKTRALFIRAERLRHHLIFYYGHTATFFVNKLFASGLIRHQDRINPKFESLFAVGVDEMSWDDLFEDNYDWPVWRQSEARRGKDGHWRDNQGRTDAEVLSLQQAYREWVFKYRCAVKEMVLQKIATERHADSHVVAQLLDSVKGLDEKQLEAALDKIVQDDRSSPIVQRLSERSGSPTNEPKLEANVLQQLGSSLWWILAMGIEHDKIHLETSSAIIAQVPISLIERSAKVNRWPGAGKLALSGGQVDGKIPAQLKLMADQVCNPLIPIPGGKVRFGRQGTEDEVLTATDHFGWDNEFGSETRELVGFQASQKLVSNAEYLQFVLDGGYVDERWWCKEGTNFVKKMKLDAPRFWLRSENDDANTTCETATQHTTEKHLWSHLRHITEVIPMQWNWPVMVSNLEAQAFCRWKGSQLGKNIRLVSHEEHKLIVEKTELPAGSQDGASLTDPTTPSSRPLNINLSLGMSPTPVDLCEATINGNTIFDAVGNVWRHSSSVLTTLPGFQPDPAYDDFSLPGCNSLFCG